MALDKTYDPLRIGNSRIYVQDTEPAGAGSGDVWLDTSDRTEVGGTIELGDDEEGTFGDGDDFSIVYNSSQDTLDIEDGGSRYYVFDAGAFILKQNEFVQVGEGGNLTQLFNGSIQQPGNNSFSIQSDDSGGNMTERITVGNAADEVNIDLNTNLLTNPKVEGSSTFPGSDDTTAAEYLHINIGGSTYYAKLFQ